MRFLWRIIRFPPQLLYKLGFCGIYGRLVLLLSTTGRKTGKPHVPPLQYEEINGAIYVAAARGQQADWFRNIIAKPRVKVRLKSRCFHGIAEPVTDPVRIADFLDLRLKRKPRFRSLIMRWAGLPRHPTRNQLETYALKRAMVVLRPYEQELDSYSGWTASE
jgi:deazaflavin-dependent oxidoreductase (nitroreductase family)